MIASALESGRCVVAGAGFAELRHDIALVYRLCLVCHGVDVLAGFLAAKSHVLLEEE